MYESTGRIQEVTVLDLARMFKTCGIQLGTDWLGISPVGHSFDIPKTSMDAWPDDGD